MRPGCSRMQNSPSSIRSLSLRGMISQDVFVAVASSQLAVIVPASLAHGVGLAPFGVSFLDEAEGVFHRDAILFGLVVVKHRGGHNLVAKRTMNSGGRHGRILVIG